MKISHIFRGIHLQNLHLLQVNILLECFGKEKHNTVLHDRKCEAMFNKCNRGVIWHTRKHIPAFNVLGELQAFQKSYVPADLLSTTQVREISIKQFFHSWILKDVCIFTVKVKIGDFNQSRVIFCQNLFFLEPSAYSLHKRTKTIII